MFGLEQVRDANTPEEMRAEIARLRRESVIVKNTMDCADYTGLSSEDRYTMLAYHALAALARTQKVLNDYVVTMPSPRFIMQAPDAAAMAPAPTGEAREHP
ncbi:MAG: hypothetical protein Q8N17_26405 [Burkholderiaceae bacterium]|nr:hypothetical protein [Burkholderiaceae bacterium]